jgi:hypothetical protein
MPDVLRTYVGEVLSELKLDKWLLNRLNIHNKKWVGLPVGGENLHARLIAVEWIDDTEYELGHALGKFVEVQVKRFVANRWHDTVGRYRGNVKAAKQTMMNMLDAEFSHLYLADNQRTGPFGGREW